MEKESNGKKVIFLVFMLISLLSTSCVNQEEFLEQPISLEFVSDEGRLVEALTLDAESMEIVDEGTHVQLLIKFYESDINKITTFTKKHINKKMVTRAGGKELFSGLMMEAIVDGVLSIRVDKKQLSGNILLLLKDNEKKSNENSNKIGENDNQENLHYKLSHDSFVQGHLSNAIKYAQEAVREEPQNIRKRMWLAYLYAQNKQVTLSIDEFEKAKGYLDKDKVLSYPGLLLSLGELYMSVGNYELSAANYQVLLEINNLKARLGLAMVYEKTGNVDAAKKEYNILLNSGDSSFTEIARKSLDRISK